MQLKLLFQNYTILNCKLIHTPRVNFSLHPWKRGTKRCSGVSCAEAMQLANSLFKFVSIENIIESSAITWAGRRRCLWCLSKSLLSWVFGFGSGSKSTKPNHPLLSGRRLQLILVNVANILTLEHDKSKIIWVSPAWKYSHPCYVASAHSLRQEIAFHLSQSRWVWLLSLDGSSEPDKRHYWGPCLPAVVVAAVAVAAVGMESYCPVSGPLFLTQFWTHHPALCLP